MSSASSQSKSVLFVCLGNICRSTLSEAVFLNVIKDRSDRDEWKVDSCGTDSWNNGSPPDHRSMKVLQSNGINNYVHVARQINSADFKNYHYILCMDSDNLRTLRGLAPKNFSGKIALLGGYDAEKTNGIIRDPYYDSDNKGFEHAYNQATRGCQGFLDEEGFN